jgi:ribonuclease HI
MRVLRDRTSRKLWLCQDTYIQKVLQKYNTSTLKLQETPLPAAIMEKFNGNASSSDVKVYQGMVGSVLYASISTRPDIARAVSHLAEFMSNPGPAHFAGMNHLFGYLRKFPNLAIEYSADSPTTALPVIDISSAEALRNHEMRASSDAAFGDCKDTRKSTQGLLITLFNGPIVWSSAKQKAVVTSSTEAELRALVSAAKELIAIQRLISNIGVKLDHQVPIEGDNLQTLGILTKKNPQFSTKLRHVDIYRFWLRQEVQDGRISLQWVPSHDMIADGLTKILNPQNHQRFVQLLGLRDITYFLPVSSTA